MIKTAINLAISKKLILLILLILGFVVLKIQDLFLPYFWDEAWSYIPAIKAMVNQGPSLLPNSISPDLYRGHPLLFYFMSSMWMKLFGQEIWITKLFPLLTSIALLLVVFYYARKNFDYLTAILAVVFLMIQSVFFAQATFLLPEILLALFTVLTFLSYHQKKRFLTILWLSLALYTKESAIIIWITISFFELIEVFKSKDKNLFYRMANLLYLTIPLFMVAAFFVAQKIIVGWFFFPEHLAYLSIHSFLDRFDGYTTYLFIFMGRNLLTFFGIIALILLLIKKDNALYEKRKVLYILIFYIVLYLLFSSVNFYSPRYLLSILPFIIIIWVYLIKSAIRKYHFVVPILIFTIVFINNLHFTIYKRGGHDHTLGNRDLIQVQSDMISYCEKHNLHDKEIFSHFLMFNNLTNKDLGYLKSDKVFTHVSSSLTEKTEFILFSSNELDKDVYEGLKAGKGISLKRYDQNDCWSELFQLKNY